MIKTVAINGSPKAKDSASGIFINQIENILGAPLTVYQATQLIQRQDMGETLSIFSAPTFFFSYSRFMSIRSPRR